MIVTIDTDAPLPNPPVAYATDQEYVQFVMASAAASYAKQFGTATRDEGIAAARASYNAGIPSDESNPEM